MKSIYKKILSIPNEYKFLGGMVLIYFIVYFFQPSLVWKSAIETLSTFVDLIPILVLVFVVMLIVNIYFNDDKISKHLGEDSGWKGWLYAIIAGILVSGPPYILFPLFGELKEKGMKNSLIAVFFFNKNVKIPFIPVMIYYFGTAFTIVLSVYIILFSIPNGYLVGKFVKKNSPDF